MPEPKIEPYDFVSREAFDRDIHQRLMADELLPDNQIKMRYQLSEEDIRGFAVDFLICVAGVKKARGLYKVRYRPVPLDASPSQSSFTANLLVKSDGMIVEEERFLLNKTRAEKGYFLGGLVNIDLDELKLKEDVGAISGSLALI